MSTVYGLTSRRGYWKKDYQRMSFITKIFTAVMAVAPAFASPIVAYTTSGVITCSGCGGSGSSTVTFGAATLEYLPDGGILDLGIFNPSNGNFGSIQTSGFSGPVGINGLLTLTITQSIPSSDAGDFVGSLTGGIAFFASNGRLLFSTSSIVLGGVTYEISQPTAGLLIVPPVSNGGITTIEGTVSAPVPEPGTWGMGLFGAILLAIGCAAKGRSRPAVIG